MASYKVQFKESYGWDDWTEERNKEAALKVANQIIKQPSASEADFLEVRVLKVEKTTVFHAKRKIGDWETVSSGDDS